MLRNCDFSFVCISNLIITYVFIRAHTHKAKPMRLLFTFDGARKKNNFNVLISSLESECIAVSGELFQVHIENS